jgi:predicted transcriptional regulator of viral defense system
MHVGRPTGTLSDFVDSLQERGQYTFSRDEALSALNSTPVALKRAAERLKVKRRLATPRRGFYTIVPLEYRQSGAPPAASFIDQLMRLHHTTYYVGLLSAAEIHGAAHQRPQEFQVFAGAQLRPVVVGRNRIRFFMKKDLARTPVQLVKTTSGRMRVSTPEATVLDLVRFYDRVGHLSHVATVLEELAEKIDATKLVQAAEAEGELAIAQRAGYLLERSGAAKSVDKLAKWVARRSPKAVMLVPGKPNNRIARDVRWSVVANVELEPDDA